MNEEVKQKWLEALRSGEYEQGKEMLRRHDDKFCCLGVLTDLYVKDNATEWQVNDNGDWYVGDDGETQFLAFEVQEWADLHTSAGAYEDGELIEDNDVGTPFSEIADIIEKEF